MCCRTGSTDRHGTTLVELTVALAIVSTIFAVLMPLFAGIRNSTDARWAGLEMVQNARVLNEHLCRHLAQARRVVAVSTDKDNRGWIDLEAGDGSVYRCAMTGDNFIEFGPVDRRSGPGHEPARPGMLAGPVEYLRFACYQADDLGSPACDTHRIRLVTWEAGLRSTGQLMQGRLVTGACYLRLASPVQTLSEDEKAPAVIP